MKTIICSFISSTKIGVILIENMFKEKKWKAFFITEWSGIYSKNSNVNSS